MDETLVLNKAKISVIVPIYKVELYLRKCLDSIVEQSYSNLEIILVDDGSPDNSGNICDEYAAKDHRIKVIHKENGGVSSARNVGLDMVTGDWVGWVDADDWIESDMYEYLLTLAMDHQADMVQCGFWIESERRQKAKYISNELLIPCGKGIDLTETQLKMCSNSNCNKLYRANILNEIYFDTSYPIGEDLLFHLHTLLKMERIYLASEAKYHYVQRNSSACNAPPTPERLESYRNMLKTAIIEFDMYHSICEFLREEVLRNNLDICSKIVRYNLEWVSMLQREIYREIQSNFGYILGHRGFSAKEKIKFTMIAFLWPVYKSLLPIWKRCFIYE